MQTHFKFLCMACTVLLCYSCGGNNPQTTSGYSEYEKPDTTNSVQDMKTIITVQKSKSDKRDIRTTSYGR